MSHKEKAKLARDCSVNVAIDSLDKKMNVLTRGHLEARYCQLNNTSTDASRDKKTNEIKQMVGCYNVQNVGRCKHCINISNMCLSRRLTLWFNSSRAVKVIYVWNKHVVEGTYLTGGT